MAKSAAITFEEFRAHYETNKACREELFRLRIPDGFVCPKCGCREYYPIRTRNTCQYRNCRRQTSVTAGTVMHRTHLPLTVWFWAMYLCATDKRGISASHTVFFHFFVSFLHYIIFPSIGTASQIRDWLLGFRLGVRLMAECMDEDDGALADGGEN